MTSIKRHPVVLIVALTAILALLLSGCGKRADNTNQGSQASSPPPASASDSAPASPTPSASPSASSPVDPNASHPVVTIEMDDGSIIKAELYPEVAPNTVNNFISLIKKGFYDGLTFHRVIAGTLIQGGDPDGNGTGDPGYSIPGEFTQNGFTNDLKHTRGVLSMARTNDPDSAGSQFFIVDADAFPSWDGLYAAFGKVTEGMDVVDTLSNLPADDQGRPQQPPVMKKVTVDTLGVDYPEPKKTGE